MTHTSPPEAIEHVSTLEMFFDLVFVFTVTQVARLLSEAHRADDLISAALILMIVFWMYGGYAWLTNNVAPRALWIRLPMLVGMAAYFVMALSIPRARAADGLPFGLGFALFAYSYSHLGMVGGIVGIAAGLHEAIAHLGGAVDPRHAWMLAGGVSLYLLSDRWFRVLLSIGRSRWRSAAALAALATAPIGSSVSGLTQIAVLVAILVAMLALDAKDAAVVTLTA